MPFAAARSPYQKLAEIRIQLLPNSNKLPKLTPRPALAQDGTVDESGLNLLRPLCSRSRNLDQAGVENALVTTTFLISPFLSGSNPAAGFIFRRHLAAVSDASAPADS